MTTQIIQINKNENGKIQYLTEVLPMIPTNTILYKTLTGLGATYGELKADRNSIIIEPNVPVIVGKCNDPKHKEDNLFGVYEGVYTEDVIKYLEKSADKRTKILTTPESFQKVKDAFELMDMDIYGTCFLLFDECHKIVKDADYRSDITLPFDDFFLFNEKALVSATPISFSDPRFEMQKFQIIRIEPAFEYKLPVSLIHTNNVLEQLKRTLDKLDATDICLFVNSTDMIYSFIKQLDIENESTVFCAKKSVEKLKNKKFKHAFEQWSKSKMKKYNFFTSRFYNALDIELKIKPTVIMISDVYFSEYSMIDPHTDAIQAIGRFRNGVNRVCHIFNTNPNLPVRTEEEIGIYLQVSKEVYDKIKTFYDCATSEEARNAYHGILKVLPFNQMLNKDGKENFFAIDNYVDEALLKSSYNAQEKLIASYRSNRLFDLDVESAYFPFGDFERLKKESKYASLKDKRKEVVRQLELLKGDDETEMIRNYKEDLRKADSFIYGAYEEIGKEMIESLDYSVKRIKEAMILKQNREKTEGTEFIQLIKNSFKVRQKYTKKYIKEELTRIYALTGVTPQKTITGQSIKEFFYVKEINTGGSRKFLLVESKI
ncbi:MAG: DEAD/DEAH box helicase family protein [Parabacteroides merdae]|nr:DEAD/DEAH box helicase family protein [Parabacteroides merdae]MDB8968152.1 DEAD/DEAH box helicase family protein [Parabacteroides merdae]MDB8971836.1 DEAD/DEAH box helicase family protein [Parabacteroides merdae]MDB8975693.1 DEAD/DEAH box helicase family protein [Parabacteroides merdae]MDB8979321.1 DEAD/DEAH box helicase family protein [Parabacteroides merdae]